MDQIIDAEIIEESAEVAPDEVEVEEKTEEVAEESVEDATEEVEEEATEESTEEAAEEVVEEAPEPVSFEGLDDDAIAAKRTEILEQYELPPDVQAVIENLQAKADADPMVAYSDYGSADEVKELLDRQSYLDSSREVESGQFRPNTDKFVESIATDETRADWLFHDLASTESAKYPGVTRLQEKILDALAVEGDTVGTVKQRYDKFIESWKANELPTTPAPAFIPKSLHEAFYKLDKDEREIIDNLDPEYAEDAATIRQKLNALELMQKGIDSERAAEQQIIEARQKEQQEFSTKVQDLQTNFYSTFRDNFTAQLIKNVTFSEDPARQTLMAHQHVALLANAMSPEGEWSRKALKEAGIEIDMVKVNDLAQKFEAASVELVSRDKKGPDGKHLDPVSFKKAERAFSEASRQWMAYAKEILDVEARVTATGQKDEIEKAVAKKKIETKARIVPKGEATKAEKRDLTNPHPYKSDAYYEWFAEREMEQAQKRAAAYA